MPRCSETTPEETAVEVAPVAAQAATVTCFDCANHYGPPAQAGDCGCGQEKFDTSMGAAHAAYCAAGGDAGECNLFIEKGGG